MEDGRWKEGGGRKEEGREDKDTAYLLLAFLGNARNICACTLRNTGD